MGERIRITAAQNPGRTLGVLAAVALLGSALAAGWTERLALSSGSDRAALRIGVRGPFPAAAPAYRVVVGTMRAQLSADPAVSLVREPRPQRGSNASLLVVGFDAAGRRRDAAILRIERTLDPGQLTIEFRGPAAAVREARDEVLDDLVLLLLALPVVALVAAGALGVRPAGAALLAAVAAAAAACLVSELLAGAFDVYWPALAGAAAGGGPLTLQLCAMSRCGAPAAAVWAAALAAASAFGATALLGVGYLGSVALGGALGSVLAAPAALAAMGATAGLDDPGAGRAFPAPWRAVAAGVAWSRGVAALFGALALCVLIVLAAPAGSLQTTALGAGALTIDGGRIGISIAVAIAVTALLAWLAGGRPGLGVAVAAASALAPAAAAGLLVLGLQEGGLEDLLGYSSSEALQLGTVVSALAILAALCASQAIGVASAARRCSAFGPDRAAEAAALFGPASTVACLSAVAAGAALAASSLDLVGEFAFAIIAGALIELLVVQALLTPALLRLGADPAAPH